MVQGTPTHGSRCPAGGAGWTNEKKLLKCDFYQWDIKFKLVYARSNYLFLQLSFAMQNIIQFHSDLEGGSKIEKVVQGAPLSAICENILQNINFRNWKNDTVFIHLFSRPRLSDDISWEIMANLGNNLYPVVLQCITNSHKSWKKHEKNIKMTVPGMECT